MSISRTRSGKIQLVGPLTLNYVLVECVVEIDVQTREGMGSLRPSNKSADS